MIINDKLLFITANCIALDKEFNTAKEVQDNMQLCERHCCNTAVDGQVLSESSRSSLAVLFRGNVNIYILFDDYF